MKLTLGWKEGMSFEAVIEGHRVPMDAKAASGGSGSAPTPKQLVLAGIAGCTGMDVVALLRKMRLSFKSVSVDAEAHQTEEQPAVFDRVHLVYHITAEAPAERVMHAVELSQSKYCGVSAMIAKSARISFEVLLNGQSIGTGHANF